MASSPQTGLLSEVLVYFPEEEISVSPGFSLDIGSSVAKLLYRSKEDYKNGERLQKGEDCERGVLHYALFPRNDVDGIIHYLKENCDFKRDEQGLMEICAAGVGAAKSNRKLEKELDVKISVVNELDCFVKAFVALTKTYSREELVHPLSEKISAAVAKEKALMEECMAKMEKTGANMNIGVDQALNASGEKEDEDEGESTLPCLLAMCGSASLIYIVNKDGTHRFLDGPITAGRFFYGLASILGGTNDFNELMKIASQGDGRSVDIYAADLVTNSEDDKEDEEKESIYGAMNFDIMAFPFGKGAETNPADIKKEDMVYSLYNTVAITHVESACTKLELSKLKSVYFCGNLFNNELGREMIIKRKMIYDIYKPLVKDYKFEFIRNGGMLGVLGAFMTKPNEATATKKPE